MQRRQSGVLSLRSGIKHSDVTPFGRRRLDMRQSTMCV